MYPNYRQWRHAFKLDPDKYIDDSSLEQICRSGSDVLIIGGSSGVTMEKTYELFARVRTYPILCVCELSSMDAVVPGFEAYLLPLVLNGNRDWLIGQHLEAIKQYGELIPWNRVITEGYVCLNPHATVSKLTEADTNLELDDVLAYAQVADSMLRMPILYLEYSGQFGNMTWLSTVKKTLKHSHLIYGGGVDSPDKAAQAATSAHTIVVGDILYENLEIALQTVDAVRGVRNREVR